MNCIPRCASAIVVVLFACVQKPAGPQEVVQGSMAWERVYDLPGGGPIDLLASNGSTLFAVIDDHVICELTDYGSRWIERSSRYVTDIAVKPNTAGMATIFAANSGGVEMSTDNGTTWKPTSLTGFGIDHLAVDRLRIWAIRGGDTAHVYRSSDDGTSWSVADSGLPGRLALSLAFSGGDAFAATLHGVYASHDSGRSWLPTALTETVECISANENYVVATWGVRGWISSNGGASWTAVSTPPVPFPGPIAIAGDNVFVAGGAHVFRYDIMESSWTMTGDLNARGRVNDLEILNNGNDFYYVFAGTEFGVSRSFDHGLSWMDVNAGLIDRTGISDLMVISRGASEGRGRGEDELYVLATTVVRSEGAWEPEHLDGVFRRSGSDNDWTSRNMGLPIGMFSSARTQGGGVLCNGSYEGTFLVSLFGLGLYKSTNHGETWDSLTTLGERGAVVRDLVSGNDNRIFAATMDGLFLTVDDGTSWSPAGFPEQAIYALAIEGCRIVVSAGEGIHGSSDNGLSWTLLRSQAVSSLAIKGNTFVGATYDGKVSVTKDGGLTWRESDLPTGVHSIAVVGDKFFAASHHSGIHQSFDGFIWVPTSITGAVMVLAPRGNGVFAVTTDGVYFGWPIIL